MYCRKSKNKVLNVQNFCYKDLFYTDLRNYSVIGNRLRRSRMKDMYQISYCSIVGKRWEDCGIIKIIIFKINAINLKNNDVNPVIQLVMLKKENFYYYFYLSSQFIG